MSATVLFWIVILALAIGTFLLRSLPFWLHGKMPSPPWLTRLLRYVPAAALTALVIPGSLYMREAGEYTVVPARIIAALVALIVALRFRSTVATLVVGMVSLWGAQYLLG